MSADGNSVPRVAHHPPSRFRRVMVCLGYLLFVTILVSMADQPAFKRVFALMKRLPFQDHGVHFFVMGGLGFAFNYALRCRAMWAFSIPFQPGTLLAFALVIAEEFSQTLFPNRVFDIRDIDAGILGAFLFAQLTKLAFHRGWMRIPPA